jgi:ATP-binding protein involved in chromosome partitioning
MSWINSVWHKARTRLRSNSTHLSAHSSEASAHNNHDDIAHSLETSLSQHLQRNPISQEQVLKVTNKDQKIYITVSIPDNSMDISDELKRVGEAAFEELLMRYKLSHLFKLMWIATRKATASQRMNDTLHSSPVDPAQEPMIHNHQENHHPHENHHGEKSSSPSHSPLPTGREKGRSTGKLSLPSIGAIIAVSSAKGGVGKSTVALQLALSLQRMGKRVGLLDADIYGPSIPHMLHLKERAFLNNKVIEPLESHHLKVMSIGCMVDPDAPLIWRGPMVMGAFEQMLRDVNWGELDVLILDMPPGTGDIQLTLAQRVPVTGAVIVSTPQDLALIDVKRGIAMFRKVQVPLLGMIENMSYFICGTCQTVHHPFGQHGAKLIAEMKDVPFLGSIPLVLELREAGDEGRPSLINDSPTEKTIDRIAENLWDQVEKQRHILQKVS